MKEQQIWKFPLKITGEQVITVPIGFSPLSCQFQNNELYVWGIVMVSEIRIPITIHIYGTGHIIPQLYPSKSRSYISTVQDGAFVWHIFEIK